LTLTQIGVTRNQSSRRQRLAALTEEAFGVTVLLLRITAVSAIGILIAWDNAPAHAPGHPAAAAELLHDPLSVTTVLIEILAELPAVAAVDRARLRIRGCGAHGQAQA
jgi:hypothetical protein